MLDLSLHVIEVAERGVAASGCTDDGPQEHSLEAGHPVVARSRDRNEAGATLAPAAVVDEKAKLERVNDPFWPIARHKSTDFAVAMRLRRGKGIDHAIDALDEKAHKWLSGGKT